MCSVIALACMQSLFFFRFSEGSACKRERRELSVSHLQSCAWSFACLACFSQQLKKKERLLIVCNCLRILYYCQKFHHILTYMYRIPVNQKLYFKIYVTLLTMQVTYLRRKALQTILRQVQMSKTVTVTKGWWETSQRIVR